VAKRQFGVSTHLYHGRRLDRSHLAEIAAHGFEAVEVFATRTHFDYHSTAAIAALQEWLADAGLELHSLHAPVSEGFTAGRPLGALSLAAADADARHRALAEAEAALHVARRIPLKVFVVHLGLPRWQTAPGADTRDAARRSVEALADAAAPLGVTVALEGLPNELSRAGSLVYFVERVLDRPDVGICLDTGHAQLESDVVEVVETVSEHLRAAHLHDNRGRADDHLPPFEGVIDWPAAVTALQKIGFEGPLMFEVGAQGPAKDTLQTLRRARTRIEGLLG
jgi:sugar phosphate isomerase/epimerase